MLETTISTCICELSSFAVGVRWLDYAANRSQVAQQHERFQDHEILESPATRKLVNARANRCPGVYLHARLAFVNVWCRINIARQLRLDSSAGINNSFLPSFSLASLVKIFLLRQFETRAFLQHHLLLIPSISATPSRGRSASLQVLPRKSDTSHSQQVFHRPEDVFKHHSDHQSGQSGQGHQADQNVEGKFHGLRSRLCRWSKR